MIRKIINRVILFGVSYDKLHLGCGRVIIPDFFNIDFDKENFPDAHHFDLKKPLPFPNNSVSVIFSEHLIEHLPKNDGINLLKECHRVLKSGGIIRFGWPDFTKLLSAYKKKSRGYRNGMKKHMGESKTGSWDEFLADCLFSWEHRYCYTSRLLTKFFAMCGFREIKNQPFGKSIYGFRWDTRNDPDTSYLEARK